MAGAPVEGEFQLIEIDEDHAKASAFNMLFLVWRRRTLALSYRRASHLVRELGTRYPEGIGVLQVVELEAVPPDAEARKAFVEFFHTKALKHYCVTHDGTGFKAAAVRAVATAAHVMARPACAHSIHASVGSAARWSERQQLALGRRESAAQIESIAQALRSLHKNKYP